MLIYIELPLLFATLTSLTISVKGVAPHKEDDLILSTVLSSKANYLVTGDKLLIDKVGKNYKEIKLVTTREFIELFIK